MRILFYFEFVKPGLEPLGPLILIALAKEKGHICDIVVEYSDYSFIKEAFKKLKIYANNKKKIENKLIRQVTKFKPDIIAYSIQTGTHNHALYINNLLKKKFNFISIFGGSHSTFFPEIIKEKGVDIVLKGECENSFIKVLDKLEKKQSIASVEGIVFKNNKKIHSNNVGELIENLDTIPFPERDILYKNFPFMAKSWMKSFITSRGCPYNCTYCFNYAFQKLYKGKGKIIRKRSVKNVINEMVCVKEKYSMKSIRFTDDTFILDPEWIKEFSKEYKEKVNIPFIFNARANLITEDIIANLKKAGAVSATMAIESGNDHLRNDILKRNMTKEELLRASKILRKYDIKFSCLNMIGLPGETWETAIETLDFNIKCKPTYASVVLFQPFPKTKLAEYAESIGIFDGDYSKFASISFHDGLYTNIDEDFKRKLINLQKLFAFVVRFPFLHNFIDLLVKAPKNNILYKLIYYTFKKFVFKFQMHIE